MESKAFSPTPAQRQAIEGRGRAMLVSAAAGSGKTAVLTDRLIARVREGADIDRFLVITFTRAAAAELKGRIMKKLTALSEAEPDNRHLRDQTARLYRAPIGTIDSFCLDLVRENAQELGLDPDFAVADPDRSEALLALALEEVLEEAYQRAEPAFLALVENVCTGRDDKKLEELLRSLYASMLSRADGESWLAGHLEVTEAEEAADAGETRWGRAVLQEASREAARISARLEHTLEQMRAFDDNGALLSKNADAFAEAALQLRDLAREAEGGSWDKTAARLPIDFPRRGGVRNYPDPERKLMVDEVWKQCKKEAEGLQTLLAGSSAKLLAEIRETKPMLRALGGLLGELDRVFCRRKREAGLCDFADAERMALRLLRAEDGGPSALARSLSERLEEVMVDEFQDINAMQGAIFELVSDGGKKLFMVGDVKQSIYRFRHAEPGIFLSYYRRFEAGEGELVLLRENFRSLPPVLRGINALFERLMSRELGDVAYDESAALRPGDETAAAPDWARPELLMVPLDRDESDKKPDRLEAEALAVARRIREWLEGGATVTDKEEGERPMRCGDIAILLRSPRSSAATFSRVLEEQGIPVEAQQTGRFFLQAEVVFTLAVLAVTDNPLQDMELLAVLRGMPFRFSPDELAAVRAAGMKVSLWEALCLRAEEDARCRQVTELIRELRELAMDEPTQTVLRTVYDRTQLMALCAAMPDGELRCGRLTALYEQARRFEQGGRRGLFLFLQMLKSMQERGEEPLLTTEGSDAVHILSVHKSKGLEYPAVILADVERKWNRQDMFRSVLMHDTLGVGLFVNDNERGARWQTLPHRAIVRRLIREDLSEQMRVLYVALTRARERLVVVSSAENPGWTAQADPLMDDEGRFLPAELEKDKCLGDWLGIAFAADGGEHTVLRIEGTQMEASAPAVPARENAPADEETLRELDAMLRWRYPYEGAVTLPSKLTATDLGKAWEPDAEAGSLQRPSGHFRSPQWQTRTDALTGTERGTAVHLVLQHIALSKTGSVPEIRGEIERLRALGFLDERQAEAVDPEDVLAFFASDIGQRVRAAERVEREFRFSLLVSARQFAPEAPEEDEILLQGAIDCWLEENGALTLIDFKTDARFEPERHETQLRAYAGALERMTGRRVEKAVLWYIRLRRSAEIETKKNS